MKSPPLPTGEGGWGERQNPENAATSSPRPPSPAGRRGSKLLLRYNNPLHIALTIIGNSDEKIDTGVERREIEFHIAGETGCRAAIHHLRAEKIVDAELRALRALHVVVDRRRTGSRIRIDGERDVIRLWHRVWRAQVRQKVRHFGHGVVPEDEFVWLAWNICVADKNRDKLIPLHGIVSQQAISLLKILILRWTR